MKRNRTKPPKEAKKSSANTSPRSPTAISPETGKKSSSFGLRVRRIILYASAPVGILALVVSILAYRHQIEVDEQDGKLDSRLLLSVSDNGPPLSPNTPTYFLFPIPKGSENARYAIPVHLSLHNTSNAHDSQVNLVLSYDRKYLRSAVPDEFVKLAAGRPTNEQHYELNSNGTTDYAKYKLTLLSAHDSQSFNDGAFATVIPYDPQAPKLFGSDIGLDVSAKTYSERDKPRNWEIRYRGIRAQDEAGLMHVMKNWYVKEIAFDIRKKTGFFAYIKKLISQDEVTMYGYAPEFQWIPKSNLFIPKRLPQRFFAFRVKPYHWRLLFDFTKE